MAALTLSRVYAILDGEVLAARDVQVMHAAEALMAGGVRLLQLRWKGDWTRSYYEQARVVAGLCREAGATLIVNDRADVALLLEAGVHVGQDDLPASDARTVVGPASILGVSTHNEAQFRAATEEPADYIALGPMYRTSSKRNPDPVVGPAELARLRSLTPKPVVAIGGITRGAAQEVWMAGADSIAVIGDLYPPGCTAADIRARAEEWTEMANG